MKMRIKFSKTIELVVKRCLMSGICLCFPKRENITTRTYFAGQQGKIDENTLIKRLESSFA